MAERKEVRLAGAGNHGMIEAGLILQEAAAIYDDLNAHHVQSYGPEARSNWSRSEVIISEGDIDYPKATQLNVLLATTQEAVERYAQDLRPDGTLIVDSELDPPAVDSSVVQEGQPKVVALPLSATAEKLGRAQLVNVVALGAMVGLSGIVTRDAIQAAVKDHVPRGGEELHLQALNAGFDLVSAQS